MPTVIPICCRVRITAGEDKHYIVVRNQFADIFLSFVALVMLSFFMFIGLILAFVHSNVKLFNIFTILSALTYLALTIDLFLAWFYGRRQIGGVPLENRTPGPINSTKPKVIVSTKPVYVIRNSCSPTCETKSGLLSIDRHCVCKPLDLEQKMASVAVLLPESTAE